MPRLDTVPEEDQDQELVNSAATEVAGVKFETLKSRVEGRTDVQKAMGVYDRLPSGAMNTAILSTAMGMIQEEVAPEELQSVVSSVGVDHDTKLGSLVPNEILQQNETLLALNLFTREALQNECHNLAAGMIDKGFKDKRTESILKTQDPKLSMDTLIQDYNYLTMQANMSGFGFNHTGVVEGLAIQLTNADLERMTELLGKYGITGIQPGQLAFGAKIASDALQSMLQGDMGRIEKFDHIALHRTLQATNTTGRGADIGVGTRVNDEVTVNSGKLGQAEKMTCRIDSCVQIQLLDGKTFLGSANECKRIGTTLDASLEDPESVSAIEQVKLSCACMHAENIKNGVIEINENATTTYLNSCYKGDQMYLVEVILPNKMFGDDQMIADLKSLTENVSPNEESVGRLKANIEALEAKTETARSAGNAIEVKVAEVASGFTIGSIYKMFEAGAIISKHVENTANSLTVPTATLEQLDMKVSHIEKLATAFQQEISNYDELFQGDTMEVDAMEVVNVVSNENVLAKLNNVDKILMDARKIPLNTEQVQELETLIGLQADAKMYKRNLENPVSDRARTYLQTVVSEIDKVQSDLELKKSIPMSSLTFEHIANMQVDVSISNRSTVELLSNSSVADSIFRNIQSEELSKLDAVNYFTEQDITKNVDNTKTLFRDAAKRNYPDYLTKVLANLSISAEDLQAVVDPQFKAEMNTTELMESTLKLFQEIYSESVHLNFNLEESLKEVKTVTRGDVDYTVTAVESHDMDERPMNGEVVRKCILELKSPYNTGSLRVLLPQLLGEMAAFTAEQYQKVNESNTPENEQTIVTRGVLVCGPFVLGVTCKKTKEDGADQIGDLKKMACSIEIGNEVEASSISVVEKAGLPASNFYNTLHTLIFGLPMDEVLERYNKT